MRLAVIPARGGSKRIPGKNIKDFLGKPIIAYSIEAAIESGLFDHVIVSSDCDEIASVSKAYGAEVPFKRPAELSDDLTATLPVIAHAIEQANRFYDVAVAEVCCLYATAPLIQVSSLKAAHQKLLGNASLDYVFSAVEFAYPVFRGFTLNQEAACEMLWPKHFLSRSQDLPTVYHDAGQFYWGKSEAFSAERLIFSPLSAPLLLPHDRVQDIDTESDWRKAEFLYRFLSETEASTVS